MKPTTQTVSDSTKDTQYFAGIDLLRIVAMLLIAILHILYHGGALKSAKGTAYYLVWFLYAICQCSVNCYAIISGFVGYGKKHTLYKYLQLWSQVFFFSICMNWFYVFTGKFGKIEFVKAILPFSFNQYWYFTSYTVTCLFMPFIDRFLEKASEKKIKKLFPVLVIL